MRVSTRMVFDSITGMVQNSPGPGYTRLKRPRRSTTTRSHCWATWQQPMASSAASAATTISPRGVAPSQKRSNAQHAGQHHGRTARRRTAARPPKRRAPPPFRRHIRRHAEAALVGKTLLFASQEPLQIGACGTASFGAGERRKQGRRGASCHAPFLSSGWRLLETMMRADTSPRSRALVVLQAPASRRMACSMSSRPIPSSRHAMMHSSSTASASPSRRAAFAPKSVTNTPRPRSIQIPVGHKTQAGFVHRVVVDGVLEASPRTVGSLSPRARVPSLIR